jgi:hypothetical protein
VRGQNQRFLQHPLRPERSLVSCRGESSRFYAYGSTPAFQISISLVFHGSGNSIYEQYRTRKPSPMPRATRCANTQHNSTQGKAIACKIWNIMFRSWDSGKNFLRSFMNSYRLHSRLSKTICSVSFSRITSLSFTIRKWTRQSRATQGSGGEKGRKRKTKGTRRPRARRTRRKESATRAWDFPSSVDSLVRSSARNHALAESPGMTKVVLSAHVRMHTYLCSGGATCAATALHAVSYTRPMSSTFASSCHPDEVGPGVIHQGARWPREDPRENASECGHEREW